MEPGDILLAEAREVDGVDLFGTTESETHLRMDIWNRRHPHQLRSRTYFRHRVYRLKITALSAAMNENSATLERAPSSNVQASPFFFTGRVSTPIILASG